MGQISKVLLVIDNANRTIEGPGLWTRLRWVGLRVHRQTVTTGSCSLKCTGSRYIFVLKKFQYIIQVSVFGLHLK